jgi:hypothetical protein
MLLTSGLKVPPYVQAFTSKNRTRLKLCDKPGV